MPKHKQKAKKHNFRKSYRKPLIAALACMLVGIPTSWLLVSAQSTQEGATVQLDGQVADGAATSQQDGAATSGKPGQSKKPSDKSSKPAVPPPASSPTPAGAVPKPQPVPAPSPTPVAPLGWHDNIIVTIFWVGEAAGAENANIGNAQSAWDGNWQAHYGGYDDPDNRNGYYPAGFTPSENPFYFALPYNDLDEQGSRKATAGNCPNTSNTISWCKNAWIKITKGNKTAYAQWQDVGPLQEDDTAYVFGSAAPKNTWGAKAGLDVSPAVRDYLGLSDVDRVGWSFVGAGSVPTGPWKNIVTTGQGGW